MGETSTASLLERNRAIERMTASPSRRVEPASDPSDACIEEVDSDDSPKGLTLSTSDECQSRERLGALGFEVASCDSPQGEPRPDSSGVRIEAISPEGVKEGCEIRELVKTGYKAVRGYNPTLSWDSATPVSTTVLPFPSTARQFTWTRQMRTTVPIAVARGQGALARASTSVVTTAPRSSVRRREQAVTDE